MHVVSFQPLKTASHLTQGGQHNIVTNWVRPWDVGTTEKQPILQVTEDTSPPVPQGGRRHVRASFRSSPAGQLLRAGSRGGLGSQPATGQARPRGVRPQGPGGSHFCTAAGGLRQDDALWCYSTASAGRASEQPDARSLAPY